MDKPLPSNDIATRHGTVPARRCIKLIDIYSLTSGIPRYYTNMLSVGDRHISHCKKFIVSIKTKERKSKENYSRVPSNATIREEHIKCGKDSCLMCPHGPYYYAYWKDENRKLKKMYIGTKYDKTWTKHIKKRKIGCISLENR
jgi:hypothetical protein